MCLSVLCEPNCNEYYLCISYRGRLEMLAITKTVAEIMVKYGLTKHE